MDDTAYIVVLILLPCLAVGVGYQFQRFRKVGHWGELHINQEDES